MLTHVYAIFDGKLKSVDVGCIEKLRHRPHLFCKLCGENVSFVEASEWRCAFFRHTPNPNKKCIEKSTSWYASGTVRQRSAKSGFFVRLEPQSLQDIYPSIAVEIALPPIGDSERNELVAADAWFEVQTDNQMLADYKADRLSDTGRSYIPIGCCLMSKYDMSVRKMDSITHSRFNTSIDGFDKDGLLFSMETGRRIPFLAEVYVGIAYVWVGMDCNAPRQTLDVESVCIAQYEDGWCAYRVKALKQSNAAVVEFIKFGAALCEKGDVAYPLWPCFVRKGELVCIAPNEGEFYGVKADAPAIGILDDIVDDGEFCSVHLGDLAYPIPFMYSPYGEDCVVARDVEIWKETFHGGAVEPFVEIWDPDSHDDDRIVPFGVLDRLPIRRRLGLRGRSEGFVEIRSHGGRRQRRTLKAQDMVAIDVEWGMSLTVYQGLDSVGEVVFKKREEQQDCEETLSQTEKRWLSCMNVSSSIGGGVPHHLLSRIGGGTELYKRLVHGEFVNSASHRTIAVIRKRLNKKG